VKNWVYGNNNCCHAFIQEVAIKNDTQAESHGHIIQRTKDLESPKMRKQKDKIRASTKIYLIRLSISLPHLSLVRLDMTALVVGINMSYANGIILVKRNSTKTLRENKKHGK
jgi:hypothetical protein